jgi:LPS export ABC transporter protein LptC
MNFSIHKIYKNIATISLVAMFFSCANDSNEVRDLFLTKNQPVRVTEGMNHVYKDSGRVTSKLITSLLLDFSNRTDHPYNEFPKDIVLVSYSNRGKDSITIRGDYCITYTKTLISELKGNVVILNHTDKSKLVTDQLYWDQNTDYLFSEEKFTLTSPDNVINGVGFESKKDLSKFLAKQTSSQHILNEN